MNREVLSKTLFELGDVTLSVGVVLGTLVALLAASLLRRRSDAGPAIRAMAGRVAALAEGQAEANRRLQSVDDAGERISQVARVLSDKQARGAFAERHMEAIVADALPRGLYAFQATLSNGTRPDCLVRAARGAPMLAVDAKFPLEAWTAWRDAGDERALGAAAARMRRDLRAHAEAIGSKYVGARETMPLALAYVPSEALFADLQSDFVDVVEAAQSMRVVFVSPSLLWCAVQIVQSVTRDARLQADPQLGAQVDAIAGDLADLDENLAKLARAHGEMGASLDRARRSGSSAARTADDLARGPHRAAQVRT